MKPIIGITMNDTDDHSSLSIKTAYIDSVEKLGAIPLILGELKSEDDVRRVASLCDGILFSGGGDVLPSYFGEDVDERHGRFEPLRDEFEFKLFDVATELNLPIMGICRGMQLINVALGGSLHQHIDGHRDGITHDVTLIGDGILRDAVGSDTYLANSFHHEAVKAVGRGLRVTAKASDGTIEAYESDGERFILGTQWHPEKMAVATGDEIAKRILKKFVDACTD